MPPPNTPIRPETPPPTMGSYTTIAGLLQLRNGTDAPPNSPQNLSPVAFQRNRNASTGSTTFAYKVDLRGINYADTVDENLMCPICRCALIKPVTTDCDHTFCRECIDEALNVQEQCPIDRNEVRKGHYCKSPKIIYNQLDNLRSTCPCCETTVPRSMLTDHLEKRCPEASIQCPGGTIPGRNCQETVKRKYAGNECMHYMTTCPDCQCILMQVEIEDHRLKTCKEREMLCELCETETLRCKQAEHESICSEAVVACKWAEYGCDYEGKRCEQQSHLAECPIRTVGPMAEKLQKQISDLQVDVRSLNEKNEVQDRHIKFLERGIALYEQHAEVTNYNDLSSSTFSSLPNVPSPDEMEPAHEYFLSLLEAQENRVNRLATDITELDSKQAVMLFNETLPIKNEMAELRSNLQVTSTHVRFLMRLRLQENQQRRFGPGPNGVSGGGGGGGAPGSPESPLPVRRLSDSTRENLTRL